MTIVSSLDLSVYPIVAVDAEWYEPTPGMGSRYLTKQFTFCDKNYKPHVTLVLWDSTYPMPDRLPELGHQLKVIPCEVNATALPDVAQLGKEVSIVMFFSPKDVEATIGTAVWRDLLVPQNGEVSPIGKMRNLTGRFELGGTMFTIKDLFGAFNTSLSAALESVGLEPLGKDLAKDWDKSRMDLWMLGNPATFLRYAVGDTIDLVGAFVKKVEQVNTIQKEALGDKMPSYSLADFKCSSGALVAKTFENYLLTYYPDLMRAVMMLSDSNDNKSWGELRQINKDLADPQTDLVAIHKKLCNSYSGTTKIHGLAAGSIRNYALLTQNTGLFGAVVQGGRCLNEDPKENPYEQYITNPIDIDLSSCYGSALTEFSFPLGIPTIFDCGKDDETTTLGEFLRATEKDLVDGLYTIYVSGSLTYEQDLLYSKYGLTTQKVLKTLVNGDFNHDTENTQEYWGREIETAHIGGEFLMTKQELKLAIVTSEVLKVLRATASNTELTELYNLQVECAVYYPRSLQRTQEDFVRTVLNPKTRGKKTSQGDSRTRVWCELPLKDFVGKFVAYRKVVKKRKYTAEESEAKYLELLQVAVKLFINTTYGDLAAPYFPMGNTVLANNITAKARTGVWMLSKALLTVQSITDGGMFSNDRVAYLKEGEKLPGLHMMADRKRFESHRGVKVAPFCDRDVKAWMTGRTPEDEQELDRLATEHINKFWGRYGLELPFNIECKYNHTGTSAVYLNKSDYLIFDVVGSKYKTSEGTPYIIKVRGAKEENHPKKLILWHLLDPDQYPIPEPLFEYRQLLGVKDFQANPHPNLMPGDAVVGLTKHRLYSPGRNFGRYKEWKRYEDAKNKAVRRDDRETQELFGLVRQMAEGKFPRRAKHRSRTLMRR